MSPSTTDRRSDAYSTVTLRFVKGTETVAILRIANESYGKVSSVESRIPDYIDKGGTENVSFIHDGGDLDSTTPIMVYCGNDRNISPLLLLEETGYDIELELLNDRVSNEMSYLRSTSDELFFKPNHFGSDRNRRIYYLYSKSYVGKGFFDITLDGVVLKIPFEIRSKKIEYINDYPKMLGDIAEFSAPLILDYKSPLFRNYSASYKSKSTVYEDFIVLEYIFNKLSFESVYEYLRNHIHSDLRSYSEEEFCGNVSFVNASDIMSMVCGDKLISIDGGIIAGRFTPESVTCTHFSDTYDTPENRVVKDLLLTLQSMIYALSKSKVGTQSEYVKVRLSEMRQIVDDFLSDKWLCDVGSLTHVPFESSILQRRHGYSELFEMYQLLGVGIAFNQDDVPGLFEGHNKKVYEVYEYWCYIRLYRCLYNLSNNKPSFKPSLKGGSSGIVTIRTGKSADFDIIHNGVRFTVGLYYNKNFDQEEDSFRSYSIRLRPDYTLLINDSERSYIINFDAKYKVKPKVPQYTEVDDSNIDSGCWEYDIYKMHTYRDALIRSMGSYVLYPGPDAEEEKWQSYTKPGIDDDWDSRDDNILPSVGAVSLTPGSKRDGQLEFALRRIFEKLSKVYVSGEIPIDNLF